jgi:hypothetical protein
MHTSVGDVEGLSEGTNVGLLEGASEGKSVGSAVGASVGCLVGSGLTKLLETVSKIKLSQKSTSSVGGGVGLFVGGGVVALVGRGVCTSCFSSLFLLPLLGNGFGVKTNS